MLRSAAGTILTLSSASFTPRGVSGWASANAWSNAVATSWFTTGTQYSGRRPYAAWYSIEKRLADRVGLVVLVTTRSNLRWPAT